MANEKRLIDENRLKRRLERFEEFMVEFGNVEAAKATRAIIKGLKIMPIEDAVPVDEIRVDIMSLSLENQEAIMNVSICGKQNEVKIPFSKDVAEVVHGRWILLAEFCDRSVCTKCSVCGEEYTYKKGKYEHINAHYAEYNYCPNCGAKMDGDGNG